MSADEATNGGEELAAAAGPVEGGERISAIDTLRGVAVLGILVMNIYAFAMPFAAYNNPLMMGGTEWYNLGTWFFTHIFFDQKFMTIFSLLFGGGLVIMWQRAEARNAAFAPVFWRRQLWLLVIGALHAYFIWFGDILFHYALVGLFVFFFRRLAPATLIVIGLLMLPVAPLLSFGGAEYMADLGERAAGIRTSLDDGSDITDADQATLDEWDEMGSFLAPTRETVDEEVAVYRSGYADIVAHRVPQVQQMQLTGTVFFVIWRVGGLMLIGMALMKLGILSGQRDAGFYRRMMALGYGTGLPIMLASAFILSSAGWDGLFMFRIGTLPNYIGSILVAFGHIAAIMLIVKTGRLSRLTARFAAVGRMALTNYLMHSLVMTTIFYGYGLGLYGDVPRAAQELFVVALIGFQLWLSPAWLRAFRFGPAEWLWRSLTYGSAQPMRRTG